MDWYGLATALTGGAAVVSAITALFTVRFQARAEAMQRARERAWLRLDKVVEEVQHLRTIDHDIISPLFDNNAKAKLLLNEFRRSEALDNALLHLEIACKPYGLSIAKYRTRIKALRNLAKKMKNAGLTSAPDIDNARVQYSPETEKYVKAYKQFQEDTANFAREIIERIK